MGADGGTIPTRDELVKFKKKDVKLDKEIELEARWFHCALSLQPLSSPIVVDELGTLYKKESVIKFLLDKTAFATLPTHIRGLKDVTELKLEANRAYLDETSKSACTHDGFTEFKSPFMCPITNVELNGHSAFYFVRGNGACFSEKALREVPKVCAEVAGIKELYIGCEDLLQVNPPKDVQADMRIIMMERRVKIKSEKKAKKAALIAGAGGVDGVSQGALKRKAELLTAAAVPVAKATKVKDSQLKELLKKESNGTGTVSVAEDPTKSATYRSLFIKKDNVERPANTTSNDLFTGRNTGHGRLAYK